jgi:hypothetical protein
MQAINNNRNASSEMLPEPVRWSHHLSGFWRQGELLVWRAARVVVETLDVTAFAVERDVVETGDGEALSRVGGGDKASF